MSCDRIFWSRGHLKVTEIESQIKGRISKIEIQSTFPAFTKSSMYNFSDRNHTINERLLLLTLEIMLSSHSFYSLESTTDTYFLRLEIKRNEKKEKKRTFVRVVYNFFSFLQFVIERDTQEMQNFYKKFTNIYIY